MILKLLLTSAVVIAGFYFLYKILSSQNGFDESVNYEPIPIDTDEFED